MEEDEPNTIEPSDEEISRQIGIAESRMKDIKVNALAVSGLIVLNSELMLTLTSMEAALSKLNLGGIISEELEELRSSLALAKDTLTDVGDTYFAVVDNER